MITEGEIDDILAASFPASDPPSWTLGVESEQDSEGKGPQPRDMQVESKHLPHKTRAYVTHLPEIEPESRTSSPVHPQVSIGHVHLKVSDLERAIGFYRDVLGFQLTQRYGDRAAFLSAGGYHHHIGLNTWESLGGSVPPPGSTGLYHLAVLYPTRAELADALRRVLKAGIALEGASDHGVSEALYLRDPDGNGVELYWDRPREVWPVDANGGLRMFTHALDPGTLMAEAGER
jgi:catechol 2,3-dioxygenase